MNTPTIGPRPLSSTELRQKTRTCFLNRQSYRTSGTPNGPIRASNTPAFMTPLRPFANNIPTFSGDGGPYWELGTASDAYYAAMEREKSRGLSAEKLST